jgi:predicted component of type VI protein secretion system
MAAFLVPLEPGACVIPLEKAIILIGRQADCDVALTTSRKISRKHCCIAVVDDSVVVRDLGSTNGCAVNGTRVGREARLRLGDELIIGDLRFRLQREITAPPPLPTSKPPASAVSASRTTAPEPPGLMNLGLPIALPEEGRDFAVEASSIGPVRASVQKTASDFDSGPLVPYQPAASSGFIPLKSDSI